MKNKILITGVFLLLILSGCSKELDQVAVVGLSESEVNPSYEYMKQLCSGLYTPLENGFLYINNQAMMASSTDESEHTLETSPVQKFNIGAWNAFDNPDNVWATYFQAIRRTNIFLNSADKVNLDLYKYDPIASSQAVYVSRKAEIKNWKYEARFLRAFYYFQLVKRYGGIPIITNVGSIKDDYSNMKRNTLAECMKFITDECDSAATVLPVVYSQTADLGRPTKGAALSLKSRTLLYAASELYNNPSWAGSYANSELISLTGDRTAKWQAAANAAKAVIDLAGTGYSLVTYNSLFGTSTYNRTEVIFRRGNSNTNTFEIANRPIGYDRGQSGTAPSQNLVDEYEVKVNATTAVPFDWNNPVHAANPYSPVGTLGRDPRLAFTVLLNNTTLMGRAVEAWVGGLDGPPRELTSRTGYYLMKYNNPTLDILNNRTSNHAWIIFRLAELYLNYAEALNEASPGNPDIKIYVDKVRQRTGIAMPALPAGLNQSQMRDAIRHERRIEFAFEDHRFWDVRRWMLGEKYFNAPLRGVTITKNPNGTFSYQQKIVENRVFEAKMYFYPIPQSELYITKWPQNPLW